MACGRSVTTAAVCVSETCTAAHEVSNPAPRVRRRYFIKKVWGFAARFMPDVAPKIFPLPRPTQGTRQGDAPHLFVERNRVRIRHSRDEIENLQEPAIGIRIAHSHRADILGGHEL